MGSTPERGAYPGAIVMAEGLLNPIPSSESSDEVRCKGFH
jgi:hypothetical protein